MYLKSGKDYRVVDATTLVNELDNNGIYLLNSDMQGFFLSKTDSFKIPSKIYGDSVRIADRVIQRYRNTNKSIGVALTGLKGSGKSLTAKLISQKSNLPTIIVNSHYTGANFETLISDLSKSSGVVIFFDEFDKVYSQKQEELLSLLDGTIQHNCIFIFTTNSKYNTYLENRLSRIHYHIKYEGLDLTTINEVIDDLLVDKQWKPQLLNVLGMIGQVNLDLLISYISEINMFNESPLEILPYLNIAMDNQKYQLSVFINGEEIKSMTSERNMTLFRDHVYVECSNTEEDILKSKLSPELFEFFSKNVDDVTIDLKKYSYLKEGNSYIFKLHDCIALKISKIEEKPFSFSNYLV